MKRLSISEAYRQAIHVADTVAHLYGRTEQNASDRELAVLELRRLWPYVQR